MRRLAVVAVALLLTAWPSSPRNMAAAQPSSLSLPPPSDEQDEDPPSRSLPPPPEEEDDPPVRSLPPPPDEQDNDPPMPRLPLSPPPPAESDAPETSLPNAPPPLEPEALAPTAPPHPRHAQLPPRQDDPPEPEPPEPPHQRQAPSLPREPTPPRTVVPPQEPGWAAVPLPLPPTPAPPRVINYTVTGCTTMLVFGDSTVDPGNNNRLQTAVKANFLPYGMGFLGGRPTGRFSNGRLITDILAEKLGIGRSIPGFHEPRLRPRQLRRGVSFASAGSGYDDATARISVCQHHNQRFQRWQTNDNLQQEQN